MQVTLQLQYFITNSKEKHMHLIQKTLLLCFAIVCFSCGNPNATPPKEEKNNTAETPSATDQAEQIADRQLSEEEKEAFLNGDVDYKVIAQDFCECSQKTIQLYKDTEEFMKSKDTEVYNKYGKDRKTSEEDAVRCCIEVKGKRTKSKLDKPLLAESLKTECPELPTALIIQIMLKAIH